MLIKAGYAFSTPSAASDIMMVVSSISTFKLALADIC
jgi:hypothetical protein